MCSRAEVVKRLRHAVAEPLTKGRRYSRTSIGYAFRPMATSAKTPGCVSEPRTKAELELSGRIDVRHPT